VIQVDPRVVDQHVQPVVLGDEPAGRLPDRVERGQVGQQHGHVAVAGVGACLVGRRIQVGTTAPRITTDAPRPASTSAVARPIPDVAPVTRQIRPAIVIPTASRHCDLHEPHAVAQEHPVLLPRS
jgi:hypothetical protein